MSVHAVRLYVLAALSTGCMDGTPLTVPPQVPPAHVPVVASPLTPPPPFPAPSRPGQIYRAPDSLYDGYVSGQNLASRYVLFDGGEFSLQFTSEKGPFFEYPGHYTSADGLLTFTFDGDARWGATGILIGDSLTVRYREGVGARETTVPARNRRGTVVGPL